METTNKSAALMEFWTCTWGLCHSAESNLKENLHFCMKIYHGLFLMIEWNEIVRKSSDGAKNEEMTMERSMQLGNNTIIQK